MILGPYRTPPSPYRTPTPQKSVPRSPPPPHGNPSPKRDPADAALHLDTARMSNASSLAHPDSPRTGVANRLNNLAIRQPLPSPPPPPPPPPPGFEVPSSSQSPRKKLRRNPQIRDLRGDVQSRALFETPRPRLLEIPDSVSDTSPLLLDVGETPDAAARLPSTPIPRGDGRDDLTEASDIVMSDSDHAPRSSPRHKRMLSPPPPSPLGEKAPSVDGRDSSMSSSSTASMVDGNHNFDVASLTWRNEEITGHLLSSPDDDGEGINGIGFRPTAAIAYARSQKRRQQVEGWRAREAREARQKRLDRRRRPSRGRGVSGNSSGAGDDVGRAAGEGGSGRRTVRFAA